MNAGWSKTGRWVTGVALATLTSLACAANFGPHGGGGGHFGGGGGGRPGGGGFGARQMARPAFGAHGPQDSRGMGPRVVAADSRPFGYGRQSGPGPGLRAPRMAQQFAANGFPQVAAARPPAMQGGGWHGDGLEAARYAGGITPVSAEARNVPRPPADAAMVRAGSIREDVARYNEERASRPVPRPPDDLSRATSPSPYRN